ncbi:MAG: response regulator [Pyrinomonadaceae bacterium]
MTKKVLIVEDDKDLHELVRVVLTREGYEVADAFNAIEGLQELNSAEIDLALLDIMMPGMDGLEMLQRLRVTHPQLRVIMMTAMSTPEAAVSALREHACDFLAKPFDIEDLVKSVRTAFELDPQEISVEVLSARPEWIELRVACDPAAIEPLERIMAQLKTDLPPTTREQITYAFREMLRNAIEHGGKNDPSQTIEVGYLRTPRVILYRIKDPGQGFKIESLYHSALMNPEGDPVHHERVRDEMGLRPGGFGILIARDMVDEMIYNERHNEVMLIKYLDGEQTPAKQ